MNIYKEKIVKMHAPRISQEDSTVPIRILLNFPHGLGDVVQSSVIITHLKKYRPNWTVDYKCGHGKHTAVQHLVNRIFTDKGEQPNDEDYKTIVDIAFYENYLHEEGVPNSKVVNCLKEVFGLKYDHELSRYDIKIGFVVEERAEKYLQSIGCKRTENFAFPAYHGPYNAVIIHPQGNTSQHKKNLADWQVKRIIEVVLSANRIPIVLDWDNRCKLIDQRTVFNPGCHADDIWGGFGSGDAETIAALISLSELFIGVDSGPGKVASATETPSLICWHGHHPIQFHDPAPNTVHLVPDHHRKMTPVDDRPGIYEYFERAYRFRTYAGGMGGLAQAAAEWVGEQLGVPVGPSPIKYVTPNGIGDVAWVLTKIRAINRAEHGDQPIRVVLSGNAGNEVDLRSVPFLRRFPFIDSVEVLDVPCLVDRDNPSDAQGRYRYQPDGMQGCHHFLSANGALERGLTLAEWLPEYPVDFSVFDEFDWTGTERGAEEAGKLGKFVAFYLGPMAGNVEEGHNRGFLWEPKHWLELGAWFRERGYRIAVIGAPYDRSYYERYVRPAVEESGQAWVDMIGMFPDIGDTYRFLQSSACLVSYQCGLVMMHHYFGGRTVTWWRPDRDSIHPHRYICFDERMRYGWLNPQLADNYYGAIYRRETVADLIEVIQSRGWVR